MPVRKNDAKRVHAPRPVKLKKGLSSKPIATLGNGEAQQHEKLSLFAVEPLQRSDLVKCTGYKKAVTTLYHATSEKSAASIVQQQRLFGGTQGSLGGGIYLCKSPVEARMRQRAVGQAKDAVVLECTVKTGNVAVVRSGKKVDVAKLKAFGCSTAKEEGKDVWMVPSSSWNKINANPPLSR
ncbi:unnamed protein product [Amoebophrya sp. A120]|nr:unnamed protein product [Amoebophrya sp. A120]|eukprot:GSA120T00004921001.1